jgi:hypothetical protein
MNFEPLLRVLEKNLLKFDKLFEFFAKFVHVHQKKIVKKQHVMTNKGMPLLPRGFQGKKKILIFAPEDKLF